LGHAAAPVRRSFPVVYLKLLASPVRQTAALAEDRTYRNYLSFALTGIALYCFMFVPVVMRMVVPTGGVPVSESMTALMKVLSQVGIYVGIAITFLLGYGLFRLFAKERRTLGAYFKLYAIAIGFVAPIYGAYEFFVRVVLGGVGMSSLGTLTEADMLRPTMLASSALALVLWVYFVAIHRRFWAMPIWKATILYLIASIASTDLGYWLMWWVGFYSARVLIAAGIVTV
ncbi:MAG: hypothetical protein WC829_20825, partial [Hyphomicrobium sp.]